MAGQWWSSRLAKVIAPTIAGVGLLLLVVAVVDSALGRNSVPGSVRLGLDGEVLAVAQQPAGPKRRLQLLMHNTAKAQGPVKMTFYMYFAHDDSDFVFSNLNAFDLPGILEYLHSTVVSTTPRKFGITRILRYKVTLRNNFKVWAERSKQFAPFSQFDNGRCTRPLCDSWYERNGYSVGCKILNSTSAGAYYSPFTTRTDPECESDECNAPVMYSLPGPCPSVPLPGKNGICGAQFPGGACESEGDLNRPGKCTYFADPAGHIRLDELVGITHYKQFVDAGNKEYDLRRDAGHGIDFWDSKRDPMRCMVRMEKLQAIFREKYPHREETFGEPPCDASE